MKSSTGQIREGAEEREGRLDEAFLRRVDSAMLMSKQADPHRIEETRRAAEEESRLANMTDVYGIERRRMRDEGRV